MRNPRCIHYPQCLKGAALVEADFKCDNCLHYQPTNTNLSKEELAGCYALLVAILNPRKFDQGTIPSWKEYLAPVVTNSVK